MKKDFQERTDEYILGGMSAEDRSMFENEINADPDKKEQVEFVRNVKNAISSRQEKLASLAKMRMMLQEEACSSKPAMCSAPAPVYGRKKRKAPLWIWVSSIAAILVVGFFFMMPADKGAGSISVLPEGQELSRSSNDHVFVPVSAEPFGVGCYDEEVDELCASAEPSDLEYYVEEEERLYADAEEGYAAALYNLGVCYENGNGVQQSYTEAVKWYSLAAEQGYAAAQYNLGVCYENGYGVKNSSAEAAKWFELAAQQGYEPAIEKLEGTDKE